MADLSIAIIGAGPRGVGVLERIAANAPELLGERPLRIHLIDPFPPGPGRIWRSDQSPLLMLNSTAADVALFPDASVSCEGPIRPGPTFYEWAVGEQSAELTDPDLIGERETVTPGSFLTRRLGAEYLAWVYREVCNRAPANVSVTVHPAAAVAIETGGEGGDVIALASGDRVPATATVMTLGHLDHAPDGHATEIVDFAARHGLTALAPMYTADAGEDLARFSAGEDVIVRGLGLAFIDVAVLLTEGRGGRFERIGDSGRLRYIATGDEPILWAGSRRGVPYHSKITYELQGPRPDRLRYFDAAAVDALTARQAPIEFMRDVWPLIGKEMLWGHYHELFTGHADRVAIPFPEFTDALDPLSYGSRELNDLVCRAVPDPVDRLSIDAVDRPLAGVSFENSGGAHQRIADEIRYDLDRRADPAFSADLGVFYTVLRLFAELPRALMARNLVPSSRIAGFDRWWFPLFNFISSGPPPMRLEQLLALADAGIVHFLGPDMWVECSESARVFAAGSRSHPDLITATAFIDGRLPEPNVSESLDPLVSSLYQTGEIMELVLTDPDGSAVPTGQIRVDRYSRLVAQDGTPHPRRFALGHHTVSRAPAFARPGTNAPVFRQNDVAARAILTSLSRQGWSTDAS